MREMRQRQECGLALGKAPRKIQPYGKKNPETQPSVGQAGFRRTRETLRQMQEGIG